MVRRPKEIKKPLGWGVMCGAEERENRRGPNKRAGLWGVVWVVRGGGAGRRDWEVQPPFRPIPQVGGMEGAGL